MLVLHSTILQPTFDYWNDPSSHDTMSSPARATAPGCHELEGTKVLLLDVHFEGNIGDELETLPLLQELNRCGVHVTAVLSGWLEGIESQLGYRSIRQHDLVESLESPGNYERFLSSEYHAVVLAPGPWTLETLRKNWPRKIDIWMAGSILRPQDGFGEDGDTISKHMAQYLDMFDPALMILRETYSYNFLVQNIQPKRQITHYLSGDLTHSFKPASASLNFWKRKYSRYKNKMLVFSRSSNVANAVSIKGRTVELVTLQGEEAYRKEDIVVLPAKDVVFATSSGMEDSTLFIDWKHQYFDRFQEHQFVVCETAEQLFGLIYHAKHVFTDRYHPGGKKRLRTCSCHASTLSHAVLFDIVVAHRFGKEFTILKYEQEQTKLVGLAELVSSNVSPETIRKNWNTQAFAMLRDTLRELKRTRKVY